MSSLAAHVTQMYGPDERSWATGRPPAGRLGDTGGFPPVYRALLGKGQRATVISCPAAVGSVLDSLSPRILYEWPLPAKVVLSLIAATMSRYNQPLTLGIVQFSRREFR